MKTPCVAHDHQRRTCIVTQVNDGVVQFIPLSYDNGFEIESMPVLEFGRLFPTVMADYPVERAATLYAQYATSVGASREAMDFLGQFVKLSAKDIEMATKTPSAKTAKPAVAAKTVKAAKGAVAKVAKEPGAPRENASQMFRDLLVAQSEALLAGTKALTDDQVFAKVQTKYGLDDNKRSYVSWYRSDAVRKGLMAAPVKEAKEEAPAKAAPAKKAAAKKVAKK